MQAILFGVVAWAASGLVARLLVGAGLTLVVYSGVGLAVQTLLEEGAAALGQMPADIVALALLSGVGEAISILGSAILSRVALTMAGNIAGLKRAT